MKRAAIGVRMHSGWGALVAVSNSGGTVEVIARRRVAITSPGTPGANQPYHFAENLELPEAEKFLGNCFAASKRLAMVAVRDVVGELGGRQYLVVGSAVLQASGRPLRLPALIGCDEFPVGYSLAGCPPAEPASASPTGNHSQLPYNNFSANGNNPLNSVSQPRCTPLLETRQVYARKPPHATSIDEVYLPKAAQN